MNIFHIKSFFYVYKVLTKRRREMKHFTKSKKQLFDEFETVSTGLTNEEVEKRRKKYGENKFIEKEKDGLIKIFFNQMYCGN